MRNDRKKYYPIVWGFFWHRELERIRGKEGVFDLNNWKDANLSLKLIIYIKERRSRKRQSLIIKLQMIKIIQL